MSILQKFKNKRAVTITALSFVILLAASIVLWPVIQEIEEHWFREKEVPPVVLEYGIPVDSYTVVTGEVAPGQNLSQILGDLGVTPSQVDSIGKLSEGKFDLRSIRVGNTFKSFISPDSTQSLAYWVYEITPIQYVVISFKDKLKVDVAQKPVRIVRRVGEAAITSSLWNAIAESKLNTGLALELSEIYAWEVDFFGLQKGDHFKVVYDEMYVDSTSIGVGKIYAAVFNHLDKDFYAFSFMQDSLNSYWNEKGESLKKAFLKAPLKFSRITSGYSNRRMHPVLKIVRPHHGIDYAAPTGTPVVSIGSGVVVAKAYSGSAGNMLKIKHNSVYTSSYMHLSRFAIGIQAGGRVRQGQVIGYVGSTGYSTGPHLDFRMWKGGSPINPLKVQAPPEKPIKSVNMAAFSAHRDSLLRLLK